jgi:hypothetical protein
VIGAPVPRQTTFGVSQTITLAAIAAPLCRRFWVAVSGTTVSSSSVRRSV